MVDLYIILLSGAIGLLSSIFTFLAAKWIENSHEEKIFYILLAQKLSRNIKLLLRAKDSLQQFFDNLDDMISEKKNVASIRYPKYKLRTNIGNLPINMHRSKNSVRLNKIFEMQQIIINLEEQLLSLHNDLLEIRNENSDNKIIMMHRYGHTAKFNAPLKKYITRSLDFLFCLYAEITKQDLKHFKEVTIKSFEESKHSESDLY